MGTSADADDGRVFTPYENSLSARRVSLLISKEDWSLCNHRGEAWGPVHVTDLETGTVVEVRGEACAGGRCFCAAVILRIVTPGHRPLQPFG